MNEKIFLWTLYILFLLLIIKNIIYGLQNKTIIEIKYNWADVIVGIIYLIIAVIILIK